MDVTTRLSIIMHLTCLLSAVDLHMEDITVFAPSKSKCRDVQSM